jgi:hypothetical protein
MATRLLSFLSDIESALLKQSAADMGPAWTSVRIVNYHEGLARMTLIPPTDSEEPVLGGTIVLQNFLLADGSLCVKANLAWTGSKVSPVVAVYSKPRLDWNAEAAQIARTWRSGPPANAEVSTIREVVPLAAMAS